MYAENDSRTLHLTLPHLPPVDYNYAAVALEHYDTIRARATREHASRGRVLLHLHGSPQGMTLGAHDAEAVDHVLLREHMIPVEAAESIRRCVYIYDPLVAAPLLITDLAPSGRRYYNLLMVDLQLVTTTPMPGGTTVH